MLVLCGAKNHSAEYLKSDGNVMELEIGALNANESAIVTVKEVLEVEMICGKYFVYKYPTSMFMRYRRTATHLADYREKSKKIHRKFKVNLLFLSSCF